MPMVRTRATAAVVLLAFVAACAAPAASTPAAPAASSSGAEILTTIVERVYGTAEQRQAGHERQFYAWHAALGRCMTGKGAAFAVPPYTPIEPNEVGPGDMLAFSPRRYDFGIARAAIAQANTGSGENPALLRISGAQRDQWIAVQNACDPATHAAENLAQAAGSEALSANLLETLLIKLQDEQAPNLRTSYITCMNTAGFPVDEGVTSGAYILASQKFPLVPDGVSDPTVLKGWAAAVAFELKAAAADWACRAGEAARVVTAGTARLAAWAGQHRAELDAVTDQWRKMPAARDAAKTAAIATAT
ncbi:hypothetical protein ACQPZJ_44595 [Actinoplanes sp. CA-054009]